MIKSYADKVTSFLFVNNYIDNTKYKYNVYLYGFEILIASLINILAILMIGAIFNKFINAIIFLACYCPIRQFSGGYHAENYRKCFFSFLCIFLITILISNILIVKDRGLLIGMFSIFNLIIISILSPIENKNNPLTKEDKINYKKKSMLITNFITILILISTNFNLTYEYSIYGSLALFWINMMMILEVIKTRGNIIDELNLTEYIDRFENGIDTEIAQNGQGISGGQAQIVAFLRAVVEKKEIIILDEATSNLDIEARQHILNILKEKNMYKLLFNISHQDNDLEFINKTIDMSMYNKVFIS